MPWNDGAAATRRNSGFSGLLARLAGRRSTNEGAPTHLVTIHPSSLQTMSNPSVSFCWSRFSGRQKGLAVTATAPTPTAKENSPGTPDQQIGPAGRRSRSRNPFHVATRESSRALVPGDEDGFFIIQLPDPGVARERGELSAYCKRPLSGGVSRTPRRTGAIARESLALRRQRRKTVSNECGGKPIRHELRSVKSQFPRNQLRLDGATSEHQTHYA